MSDAEQARAATLVQARQRGKNARRDVAQRSELRTGKLQKENSMLLQGFDVDEDSEKTVAEQLRDALAKASVRVIDLFREWDDDQSGTVTRKEFHRAMREMKFEVPKAEIDALFTEWDPDNSGALELKELGRLLRRGSTVKLDPKLQAGAMGKIETRATNKTKRAPRTVNRQNSVLLQGFDIDEDSDKSVAEQLRDALAKASVRVIDLFREWDDDQSGTVTRKEFHRAMREMKFEVPKAEIDALFTEWDPDNSGALELKELGRLLRRGSTVQLDPKLQAGAMGKIETKAMNKTSRQQAQLERREREIQQEGRTGRGRARGSPSPSPPSSSSSSSGPSSPIPARLGWRHVAEQKLANGQMLTQAEIRALKKHAEKEAARGDKLYDKLGEPRRRGAGPESDAAARSFGSQLRDQERQRAVWSVLDPTVAVRLSDALAVQTNSFSARLAQEMSALSPRSAESSPQKQPPAAAAKQSFAEQKAAAEAAKAEKAAKRNHNAKIIQNLERERQSRAALFRKEAEEAADAVAARRGAGGAGMAPGTAEARDPSLPREWRFRKTYKRSLALSSALLGPSPTRSGGARSTAHFFVGRHERLVLATAEGTGRLEMTATDGTGAQVLSSIVYDEANEAPAAASPRPTEVVKRLAGQHVSAPPAELWSGVGEFEYEFTLYPPTNPRVEWETSSSKVPTLRADGGLVLTPALTLTFCIEVVASEDDMLSEPMPSPRSLGSPRGNQLSPLRTATPLSPLNPLRASQGQPTPVADLEVRVASAAAAAAAKAVREAQLSENTQPAPGQQALAQQAPAAALWHDGAANAWAHAGVVHPSMLHAWPQPSNWGWGAYGWPAAAAPSYPMMPASGVTQAGFEPSPPPEAAKKRSPRTSGFRNKTGR